MTFDYVREGDPVEDNPVQGTVGDDGRWNPDASREHPGRLSLPQRRCRRYPLSPCSVSAAISPPPPCVRGRPLSIPASVTGR